ncbi:Hsp20/alpha crystallin family protein [Thermomonas hydrothermalis]|uniref:Heat shock protein Hsp20 n=1 Tax=Thermomonas hydrothermalis TaxID=213588 RepID=A0A1M4T7X2_9GAMM|nr:Hsp20/alpha crystallin family protein [Thermomonas hydrothermalis]MCL6618630.1 Hsp20/alpha crystallin family protein [Thermomonas hydrothermalis]SHE40551.1 heat shock protein Hsp20 [Thermomonas hydrothermalis]
MNTITHTQDPRLTQAPRRTSQLPFPDDVRQLFERFFQLGDLADGSSVVTSEWTPRVDIREEDNRFVILADLPGVDPDDVEIMMDKGILSIKGERKSEVQEHAERYSRIERRYGMFHRRFALPDSADPDGITAQGHNGVLEISIPKRPETTPRRIPVGKRETRVS